MKRLALFLVCALLSGGVLTGCADSGDEMADTGITSLQVQDVRPGSGAEAVKGQTVRVHYTGWLYDVDTPDHRGQKFDSSKDGGEPFEFVLGAGEVITGWDEGVAGMKAGGTRVLTIPPGMAYGSTAIPDAGIPANATLVFEIELVEVR